MKKYSSLPAAVLMAFVVVACGKADSSNPVAGSAPVAVDPNLPPAPAGPASPELSQWCWQSGGAISSAQSVCKLQFREQRSWDVMGTVDTSVYVLANDTVSINATKSPEVIVGNRSYGETGSFIAASDGYIILRGDNWRTRYKIRSIQITRCYSAPRVVTPCPAH